MPLPLNGEGSMFLSCLSISLLHNQGVEIDFQINQGHDKVRHLSDLLSDSFSSITSFLLCFHVLLALSRVSTDIR